MTEFATFGDPSRFEIAVRWTSDSEPRARRPAAHGWSMGDLRITVCEQILTKHRRGAASQSYVSWYLSPVFGWLAANWVHLLHEEDFSWPEKTGAPAVAACHRALDRWIAVTDPAGKDTYRRVQEWYRRHSLRSAANGGLFPDLFIRRLLDDIELSWTPEAPLFAPEQFAFVSEPGFAALAVEDVAGPLWEALQWAASSTPELNDADKVRWRELGEQVDNLPRLSSAEIDRAYVNAPLLELVRTTLCRSGHEDLLAEATDREHPYVRQLSPAVAMFGGVSPNLGVRDVEFLCSFLASKSGGRDYPQLADLVSSRKSVPVGVPHNDGYNFAEDFLTEIGLPGQCDWIDIRNIVTDLGIEVVETHLEASTIRGVALAGESFAPTALVNTTSVFNSNEFGKRFTIAHELCHILFDRSRARRITHVSGPWVAPAIERRANAFAAYLLMPRALLVRQAAGRAIDAATVTEIATKLKVNESALVEHLYNIDLIDVFGREELRLTFRRH